MSRSRIYDQLLLLNDGQFEDVITRLPQAARVTIPPHPAERARRAEALAALADQSGFREHLELALGGLAAPPPTNPATDWLDFGLNRHSTVRIHGFREQHNIRLTLDRIFVPLAMNITRPNRDARDARGKKDVAHLDQGHETSVTIEQALAVAHGRGAKGLVLLGHPGAGKTTILKHIFTCTARRTFPETLAHLGGHYPVLLRLAQLTDAELCDLGLRKVIERVARDNGYPEAGPRLIAARRPILFLLDGLDEVRDETTRRRICHWLNDEVHHWPGSCFVATSRFAAWKRTPGLDTQFLPVALHPLGRPAVTEYVHRWFRAMELAYSDAEESDATAAQRAEKSAEALLAVLFDPRRQAHQRLAEMTGNPLLLSTLCLVHYRDHRLPEQRSELYDRSIGLLLETWPSERQEGAAPASEKDCRLGLQPLAHAMHERELREIEEAAALSILGPSLAEIRTLKKVEPADFLRWATEEAGILMSHDLHGPYEFFHLSFQEYLAAAHVAERGLASELGERAGDPRWEEVILLAACRSRACSGPSWSTSLGAEERPHTGCSCASAWPRPTAWILRHS